MMGGGWKIMIIVLLVSVPIMTLNSLFSLFFLHFLAIFWKVHFYYMAEVKQWSSEKHGDSVDEKFYFSYER